MDARDFEELINDLYEQNTEPLQLHQVLLQVKEKAGKRKISNLKERVLEWFKESHLYFLTEAEDDLEFFPHITFFKDAVFRITPTGYEIRNGILIPGHRFMPFIPYYLPSFEAQLKSDIGIIGRKYEELNFEELRIYYSLFNMNDRLMMFMEDNPVNEDRLTSMRRDPESGQTLELSITVFDMQAYYEKHNFQLGDSLVATVNDWLEGEYTIRYSPAEELTEQFAACRSWCDVLEKSLLAVFEEIGPLTSVPEQLAEAFYVGEETLRTFPGMHVGGFLAQSKSIEIAMLSTGNVVLWYAGEEPDEDLETLLDGHETGIMTGRTDSLDSIMGDMGLTSSQVELEARIRDELFHGGDSLENVFNRFFHGLNKVVFASEEQAEAFFQLAEELWDNIVAEYNPFADAKGGNARSCVLELLERQTSWLRSLDERNVMPSDLPGKEMFLFGQITAMLDGCLQMLNAPAELIKDDLEEIMSEMEQVEQSIDQLIQTVELCLSSSGPQLSLVESNPDSGSQKGGAEWTNTIYQFKIVLAGSKPPIWRRVLVPAYLSLQSLHAIIQVLFDWDAEHMHSFKCGTVMYGPDDPFDPMELHPEEEAAIYELGLKEDDTFDYTYDFGDDWRHTIKLEKVLARDPNMAYPVCTAARKAAPPEDCGGISGYYMMLDALNNPEHPGHEEYTEWYGGTLEPDCVDKDEINRILKGWKL